VHEQKSVFHTDEQLLDSKQTRSFFGNVSSAWIGRRLKEREDEIKRGGVPFPLPRCIGDREYYQLGELREYRDSRPRVRVIKAPPPPRPKKGKRWHAGEKIDPADIADSSSNNTTES
jgi:hypothetical protein